MSQAGSTPVLPLLGGLSGNTSTAAEPERPFVNFLFFLTKVLSASAAVEVFPDGFPTLVYLLPNIVLFEYNPPRESIIFSSFLFQYGVEELYILSQAGSTPVLSLLGGLSGKTSTAAEPERPFVNESNIIMYLDMVNERSVELKGNFYL